MAIETLADIIEELAGKIGIYGAHGTEGTQTAPFGDQTYHCRMCFESALRTRIANAVEVEAAIAAGRVALSAGDKHD